MVGDVARSWLLNWRSRAEQRWVLAHAQGGNRAGLGGDGGFERVDDPRGHARSLKPNLLAAQHVVSAVGRVGQFIQASIERSGS